MKYLLMYNPVSGKGKFKKKVPFVVEFFKKNQMDLTVYESKCQKDLEDAAYRFANEYDVYLVSGGDGSINEVINGMMKSPIRPKLALLPSGTANDIAHIMGVPKKVEKALEVFMQQHTVAVDINQMNDRYFVYTFAAGLFTRISYDISRKSLKLLGYLAYLVKGAFDLLRNYRMPMTIETKDQKIEGKFVLAIGLCSSRVAGRNVTTLKNSKINDGLVELTLIKASFFKRLRVLRFFLNGGKLQKGDYRLVEKEFHIQADSKVTWNLDGECGFKGNIHILVHQEAITFYASQDKVRKIT